MDLKHIAAGILLVLPALALGVSLRGQTTSGSSQTTEQHTATNLKVLPKDISAEDLHRTMKRFTVELGVPCGYCHAENPATKKLDFASDDNPLKGAARLMITMTYEANQKYLAQLGSGKFAPQISCGTCHRGYPEPPDFEPNENRNQSK